MVNESCFERQLRLPIILFLLQCEEQRPLLNNLVNDIPNFDGGLMHNIVVSHYLIMALIMIANGVFDECSLL